MPRSSALAKRAAEKAALKANGETEAPYFVVFVSPLGSHPVMPREHESPEAAFAWVDAQPVPPAWSCYLIDRNGRELERV